MAKAVLVSAMDTMRHVTLDVRITDVSQLRIRLWLGKQLMRLAAFVMGCGIEIDTEVRRD